MYVTGGASCWRPQEAGSSSAAGASKSSEQQQPAMGLSTRCECVASTSTSTRTRTRTSTPTPTPRNNNDAPDAVLEGLAMAGLVAILRQLGDLAELAAEVFDDMQDQVMTASARGRRLAVRAKVLLEADLDLPQPTSTHSSAAALTITTSSQGAGRLGCRAHLRGGGVGEGGTPPMPRLLVQRIRRCRGPPRLSLLDRFDAAGHGACLKRYTDPSFFFRAHSAKQLEQGTLRGRENRGPYLKSMSMETSRRKFQTAFNSEPPESAHTVTDCKSESAETETDASETPSPSFLSMLRQLKQHRQSAGSVFRMQQTIHRVESSPQFNMEQKLQGSRTAQPSPSELERTSSFEAWLSPDACRFATTTAHHHEHGDIITQPPPHSSPRGASATTTSNADADADAALSSSTMLKANKVKSSSNRSRSRYKGSVETIASRVSSLPRKLFSNIKHHNDCSRSGPAGTSLQISHATGIGDCSSPEPEAIPTPREPVLLHSDPVYSSMHNLLLPENDKCYPYLQNHESIPCNVSVDAERHHQQEQPSTDQCSNSNSSTPENIVDSACALPDSKNLLLPASLVPKRAGALPPENSSSGDPKVDTTPPLPPIPPMQWLPEKVHTGTQAASPKHRGRALWKKTLEVTEMIQAIRQAQHSHSIQTSAVDTEETLVSDENTNANASGRDETKCCEETRHPQPSRVREDAVQASSEGIVLNKAGEFPMPAELSDEAWSEIDLQTQTQAQADTCFQQQGRQQFCSSGHSDEKRSGEHEASDSSSNLQNESVFFSAVQELAKMSPPPPVPRPKYSLLDAGCHGRITLRNGPSLIHPSRNILDRSVLIKQIKDIAMAGNPSFKLKPVSGASSPQSPMTGSPTNSKVATILQRADEIHQAHADSNVVDSEESWSDDSE